MAPALVVCLVTLMTTAGRAQSPEPSEDRSWAADPFGDVAFLTVNAAIGGLTAGLWQELSGGSFTDAFAQGALGGSAVYAGKRLAAESFFGAGFLGRGVSSVGSSVIRNAADGRDPLDRIVVPVGPLRLYATAGQRDRPRVEVNLRDAYWTVYGLVEHRLTMDVKESLSAGAPVFRSDRPLQDTGDDLAGGLAAAGVIFLGPVPPGSHDDTELVLPHERAHVIQHDFIYQAWMRPLEDRLAGRLPYGGFVRRVDYDLIYPVFSWIAFDPLWPAIEAEADFLGER